VVTVHEMAIKLAAVIIEAYHFCQLRTKFYPTLLVLDHQCGFRRTISTTDQIFCIRELLEKKWECNGTVQQLFIDFKKSYYSARGYVLYNIII
jgi:hypothetical protein